MKMVKVFKYLLFLIIGNFLIMNFAFTQSSQRYFAVLGLIILIYSIITFSIRLPGLFTGIFPTLKDVSSENKSVDKRLKKHSKYSALVLVAAIIIQAGVFYQFFQTQESRLIKNGIQAKAFVYHKEWDTKGKRNPAGYYISYHFKVENKLYNHTKMNDFYNVGDTIEIIYLPDNPNNHMILDDK